MQEKTSAVQKHPELYIEIEHERERQKYLCQTSSHLATSGHFHMHYGFPNVLKIKDLAFYSVSFPTALHQKHVQLLSEQDTKWLAAQLSKQVSTSKKGKNTYGIQTHNVDRLLPVTQFCGDRSWSYRPFLRTLLSSKGQKLPCIWDRPHGQWCSLK